MKALLSALFFVAAGAASLVAQPLVVASNGILQSLTQEIAGGAVRVESLLPYRASTVDFEPTEEHATLLNEARLLVVNGAGYEPWLADLEKRSTYDGPIVVATEGVPLYDFDGELHAPPSDDPSQPAAFAVAVEYDPHAWLDPRNAVTYVENIRNGLADFMEGQSRTEMEDRANALIREIRALHYYAERQLATIPPARRVLVTPHDTLSYFLKAYGYRVTPITGLASGQELRPAQEARLIQTILELDPPAVFFEATANIRQIRRLATETNVKMVTSLLTTEVGPANSPTSKYVAMIRSNVDTIVEALRDPNAPATPASTAPAAAPATK